MANFSPLMAEIVLGVWGTPANFNGFHVLASLQQWRRSMEANKTLHNVWPSPTLYIHIRGLLPLTEFHVTCKSCVLLCWQRYCTALQQRVSSTLCDVVQEMELQNFRRGRCPAE